MAEWSALVTLNGQDVSGRLVGRINVEAEESTSRVASFTILPLSGLIQAGDWIGASTTIDYILDPNGVPVQTRLFTGNVNKSVFDPTSGFVSFECTDNLQGHFEVMTEAQILSVISGGRYAVEVFGEREDGWQQAVDVLSTVDKGYDLDRDGVTAALTDWAAKATADYSYNNSTVIDASVETDLTRLRDLINTVNIEAEYRFTRLHHREHDFTWAAKIGLNGGFDFCDYFANSYELPTRDMVQGAGAAGWTIKNDSITFETLPVTGSYNCGGTVGWIISEELLNQLVVDAEWTVVRRWTQTITESYSITIQEGGSVGQHGALVYEDGAGWQTDFDDSGWDSSTGTEIPDGWAQNAIGDYTEDQLDRSNSDNVLLTLIQIGTTRICQSHRQNFVSWETELEPDIERSHTASISSSTVTAKGKVFQYVHIMDIDAGSATSNIKVAVSKTWGGGSDGPLFTPLIPDTEPSHTPPSSGTSLDNRIGNDQDAPVFDENWTGFTGNFTVSQGTPSEEQQYPRRFRVQTADIETESRDEVSASRLTTYDIKCPDETLLLTVGLGPGETVLTSNGSGIFAGSAVGAITIESVLSSAGVSTTFIGGSFFAFEDAALAASGVGLLSGVGAFNVITSASLSAAGIATSSLVGSDGTVLSVLDSDGSSAINFSSASIVASDLSFTGTSSFSAVAFDDSYPALVIADSPVGYWRLGESSGITAVSEINSPTNDGTITGSPTLGATGAIINDSDTAYTNTANNQYVGLINGSMWDGIGDFTIEVFLKSTNNSRQMIFWDKDSGSGSNRVFLAMNRNSAGNFESGAIDLFTAAVSANNLSASASVNDGNFHHIVAGRSGSSGFIYIDGISQTTSGSVNTGDLHDGQQFKFGNVSTNDAAFFFEGTYDEVAFYDYALSGSEILDHYNASGLGYADASMQGTSTFSGVGAS